MRSHILIFALALATTAANGGSTIEVTSDNSPYQLTADVTDATTLSIAEGCVLDLNGHNLVFVGDNAGLTFQSGAEIVSDTSSTLTFALSSSSRFAEDQFANVTFNGKLKIVINGKSTGNKWLFGGHSNGNPQNNNHTGGTVFDSFNPTGSLTEPTIDNSASYVRFGGYSVTGTTVFSKDLGEGSVTLRNGSLIAYTGPASSADYTQPWSELIAENTDGNAYTNVLRMEQRLGVRTGMKVKGEQNAKLLLASKNSAIEWNADFSEYSGWLGFRVDNGSLSGASPMINFCANFDNIETIGFPKAKVQIFEPTNGDNTIYQFRLKNFGNKTITIGELSTPETLKLGTTRIVVMNVGSPTMCNLKVGILNTDATFNGTISKNGAHDIAIEKAGEKTWTLGGANTYTGGTTISGGTLEVANNDALSTSGNIVFAGGTLKYGENITADYSARIKNSTSPIYIDTGDNDEIEWATAIDDTNISGITKSGNGTLKLSAAQVPTGAITVEAGTLKYSAVNSNITEATFKISEDAVLELEDNSTDNQTINNDDTRRVKISGAGTLRLKSTGTKSWRLFLRDALFTDFTGTIEFAHEKNFSTNVGGFMDAYSTGLKNATVRCTGTPNSSGSVIMAFDGNCDYTVGAIDIENANARIYVHYQRAITFGSKADSVINGGFTGSQNTGDNAAFIKVGNATTLTLGQNFVMPSTATLEIKEGTLINYANLSEINLTVYEGITFINYGTIGTVIYKNNNGSTVGVFSNDKITNCTGKERAQQLADFVLPMDNDKQNKSYFTRTVTSAENSSWNVEYKLDESQVTPKFEADAVGQAATIEGQSIKFNHENMNLKPGLYYAISAMTDPDEEAKADSYTLYTAENASNFSLSADLPESGVKYYKVLVSDNEKGD